MKKGIIALALVFGFGYAYSQDDSTTMSLNCEEIQGSTEGVNENQDLSGADSLSQESSAQFEEETFQSDEFARGEEFETEEEIEIETEDMTREEDLDFESEDQSYLEESRPDADIYYEQEVETETYTEEATADTCVTPDAGAFAAPEENTTVNVENNVDVTMEDDESTLENVVEAPFKFIGNVASQTGEGIGHIAGAPIKGGAKAIKGIAKGAFSVVSEVGEGVGHVVSAPFVGIAKLFGAGKNEVNEKDMDQMDADADIEVETEVSADADL